MICCFWVVACHTIGLIKHFAITDKENYEASIQAFKITGRIAISQGIQVDVFYVSLDFWCHLPCYLDQHIRCTPCPRLFWSMKKMLRLWAVMVPVGALCIAVGCFGSTNFKDLFDIIS